MILNALIRISNYNNNKNDIKFVVIRNKSRFIFKYFFNLKFKDKNI